MHACIGHLQCPPLRTGINVQPDDIDGGTGALSCETTTTATGGALSKDLAVAGTCEEHETNQMKIIATMTL